MNRFLACFIATHTGIITSISSTMPHGTASTYHGTLPYQTPFPREGRIHSFGDRLESRLLSAQIHLTGELLRFL